MIAGRLSQGDWKIIEDYEPYLTNYLSTVQFREGVMAICGVLSCPMKFNHSFYTEFDKEMLPVNFEGAV